MGSLSRWLFVRKQLSFCPQSAGAGQVTKELFGHLSRGTSSSRSHLPVECTELPKSPTSSAPLLGTAIELSDPF